MTCLYGDRDEDKGQSGYERRAGHPLHERRFNLQGFTTKAWNDFCKDGCNLTIPSMILLRKSSEGGCKRRKRSEGQDCKANKT